MNLMRWLFGISLLCCLTTTQRVAIAAEDWPMWRADAGRSAATSNTLPEQYQLLWEREFGPRTQAWDDPLNLDLMTYDRVFEPIVLDGRIFVGFNDQSKLIALDGAGRTLWTFFTEAPVRLPPVGWNGNVFFCSDDGFLYCVQAATGTLEWKFNGSPNAQHAIGNRRLTSAWPARGGPVIYDDTVYFAASIWPFMGTFLYALNAEDGSLVWINDRTGAQYIKQPHSAPSFAGVAPQGALVATHESLIVPGGRSVPAVFDRRSGELQYFEINAGGKGTGGSFVAANASHFFVHTRENGTRAFDIQTGLKTAFTPNEPVLADGMLYSAEANNRGQVIRAYELGADGSLPAAAKWEIAAAGSGDLVLAGEHLVAAGGGQISIIQVPAPAHNPLQSPRIVATFPAKEDIARLLVADRKILAVTLSGSILAFGDPDNEAEASQAAAEQQLADGGVAAEVDAAAAQQASQLLDSEMAQGYAFWFGNASEPRLWALAADSPFEQLVVVDADAERVAELRSRLDARGLHGRVTVHASTAQTFRAPQYVGHMVFVSPELASSASELPAMYEAVRPYGGSMLLLAEPEERAGIASRVRALELERGEVALHPQGVSVRRVGALPGSADWTHQYGNIANTIKSDDARVKLPLGILWFGGTSNMDVLPRHGHGPPEQVVGGRLFIQGMNCLSARDVYTGRLLWKREFEDLGTYDIFYDATYDNTPLDTKYNQVHIPGANGRGTNYVVTEDRIYILDSATCLMLDPASGETIGQIELPRNAAGEKPEWGYLGVYENILLGGLGFANYRERYDLNMEADEKLSASRAGFGSKSFDSSASRGLVAYDRYSGDMLWQVDAKHSFGHNAIVAGKGRIYCLDKNPTQIEDAMRRRGLSLPDSYRLLCLDARTGSTTWEVTEGIFGTWLGYSEQHDLLLQAGAQASDRLYSEVGQGMRVYRADTGQLQWKNDTLKYSGPCILHNDLIYTNANSYSESAGAFYLTTGKQRMIKNSVTGELQPWKMTRAYGCNSIIASENMLTFRSGAAGYYDLLSESGTGNFGGFKSGCTSNLVVANGVLNAPDYTRTCSCGYQNQTSLALVHMPDIEMWSVSALAASEKPNQLIDSVGINFGAPGDRRDAQGTLWLEYPVVGGESPPLEIKLNQEAAFFQQHSSLANDIQRPWIAASGIEGVTEINIDLLVSERHDLATGVPVAAAVDDAEENEQGEVSLTSSDLELVEDGNPQLVALRFQEIGVQRGAKIKAAYVQFTCDETTSDPASLMLVGELSPNAAPLKNTSHNLSARPRTKSEVLWTPEPWVKAGAATSAQRTPDLSSIVQEIVNQPDWEAGNSLALLLSGTGKRVAAAAVDGNHKQAPKLVVQLEPNSGSPAAIASRRTPQPYDLELIFANTRDSQERLFDVHVQGKLAFENVRLAATDGKASAQATSLILEGVAVSDQLVLNFVAKQGKPLLCGLRLSRSAAAVPKQAGGTPASEPQ